MNLLCKIGFHKKKEISMYKCEETDKNSDAVQNGEDSPIELTLLHYWTFYHHYKCQRCEAQWIGYFRII